MLGGVMLVAAALVLAAAPLPAQTRTDATDATVLADRRLAAGYLRTGNAELAALALERLVKALPDGPLRARAGAALAAVDAGDLTAAADETERLADDMAKARRTAGRRVFADCVRDLSAVYAVLDASRTQAPDLTRPEVRADIVKAAAATDAAFALCDGEAPADIKADPDFRRLVDGSRASLARLPDAVATTDRDMLHRFLIELRAFEQLLRFRFG
ncbi:MULTISPECIES: hypothetical protein [Rhodoplanes]|nr:hypothetical protein [Rhodoplanes serenus]